MHNRNNATIQENTLIMLNINNKLINKWQKQNRSKTNLLGKKPQKKQYNK